MRAYSTTISEVEDVQMATAEIEGMNAEMDRVPWTISRHGS